MNKKFISLTKNHSLRYVPENDRYALYCGDTKVSGKHYEFITPKIAQMQSMTHKCPLCGDWAKNEIQSS